MSWPATTRRTSAGEIEIGGVTVTELADAFGTPLYVFDERTLRDRARAIRQTFEAAYARSKILYAGKAYLSPALMRILAEEGLGLDVVSGGEIYAGLAAGVDPSEMLFHGNNKSRTELREAVLAGVGMIAIDNDLEISLLDDVAREQRQPVEVVLRLNPGVDPHTHAKMRTGATDSKFGFPVWDGQAEDAARRVCASDQLRLVGYHAHVGSQIFDAELVAHTIGAMMEFAARVSARFGILPTVLIPGGGFGIADDASGADVDLAAWARTAAEAVRQECRQYGWPEPVLMVEPGRAVIGPAGVALYEVGARKHLPGVRTYVSIDGGMADNIRPALYGARYSAQLANRDGSGGEVETVTLAGKFCESGDMLIEHIELPDLQPGDLLAVPMAGAYCLAMASNYNLSPRPAAVLVNDGEARLIRRRESYEDVLRCEVLDSDGEPGYRVGSLSARKGSL
jgi:diaminopimelate decarboxylase